MKPFLDNNFLLQSKTAETLYHQHAAKQPIIDYHNHLPPQLIAEDYQFKNITELWLKGDHYKWRAMRTMAVPENDITGNATDEQKFLQWAKTVPYTMRNPLYHWTHLELQRYFGITDLLNQNNALEIYNHCNNLLQQKEFSAYGLLKKMNVEVLCTTDDSCDDLQYHQQIKQSNLDIKVLPTFRPDAAIAIENSTTWNTWVNKLATVCNTSINAYDSFLNCLTQRHDFFASMGCKLSDHGIETMYAQDYDENDIEIIFLKARCNQPLSNQEIAQFKAAVLYELALLDHKKNWVAQWHIGAIRNNNTVLLNSLGADAGVDSIGDFNTSKSMASFFNKLNITNQLSKTIIYNLNPADNEVYATMIGNFQNENIAGKMQYGSGWWFLDQKDGMTKQINALSNMGLLSQFVGMLTDSRSFLSFPRHEYFRRLLCNILATDIQAGELPIEELNHIGKMVENICYYNAKQYFNF
jgi:glucuronate isomerase